MFCVSYGVWGCVGFGLFFLVYKVGGVLDFLVLLGVWVVFLFVCFADFDPVVFVWSKVGACLRKVRARTVEVLAVAISEALSTITISDIEGWIKHCGYRL